MLEDTKTEKVAITDVSYIDFYLHAKGLGKKDADDIRDQKLQRLLRMYTTRTQPIMQRNADRARTWPRRREAGIQGVDDDEPVQDPPTVPDTFRPFTDEQQEEIDSFTEAFHHYSRALQYTLTQ
eukprot:5939506-Amphidinium_carterae.1